MKMLFSPSWWVQMFLSTLMTMVFIYLIKVITSKVNIPVISTVAESV